MEAWDVITHGGGEGLLYTFNAVAAIFNKSKTSGNLAASLMIVSGSFATAIAVFTMVAKQDLKLPAIWLISCFILMNALMLPKTKVIIIDRITGLHQPVANVPYLLGAFAGISSQLGDFMALKMDQIFSGPIRSDSFAKGTDVMNYRSHGVAMASQLVAKASRFTITDPDMATNMREFVQQCVVYDIAKGVYSLKELLQSNDAWKLLYDNASRARGFPYRASRTDNKILTCKEGAEKLNAAWEAAYNSAKKIYGTRFFPHSKNPATTLVSNLQISYEYLSNLSMSAEDILRQNMMINALEDGVLNFNQMADATAAITGYATTRAQEQQKTAYALQGNMASLSLSVLKIVVEVLFYAIFPIIAVIAILPGGTAVLKKYLIALFWIQSWAPMYSILNMIVNIYGRSKSLSAVIGPNGSSLSFATLPGLAAGNEWVASVAGYAMMSVPFLTYGLIHYGAGALSQLSTHFGSITQAAAGHAAEEATTGNYSLGNTNFDNHSRHNVSGFKHDTNMSIATGRTSMQLGDGSFVSQSPRGDAIFDRTQALSKIGGNINWNESLGASFSSSAEKAHREALQNANSFQENLNAAIQGMQDFRKSRAEGQSLDKSFHHGEAALESQSLARYIEKVEQFAKDNKITFDEASTVLTSHILSGRGNVGFFFGSKTLGGGVGLESNRNSQTSEAMSRGELLSKAKQFIEKEGLTNLLQKSISDGHDSRYSLHDSGSSAYATSIAANLSKAEGLSESVTASLARESAYRDASQYYNNQGMGFNQDMSQQYVSWLSEQSVGGRKLGAAGAHHVLSDEDLNRRYMLSFVSDQSAALGRRFEQDYPKDSVEERYEHNRQNIKHEHAPEELYKKYEQGIQFEAEKAGLMNPIDSSLKSKAEQRLSTVGSEIEAKETEIKRQYKNQETLFDDTFSRDTAHPSGFKMQDKVHGRFKEAPEITAGRTKEEKLRAMENIVSLYKDTID